MATPADTTPSEARRFDPRRAVTGALALAVLGALLAAALFGLFQLHQARIERNQLAWIEQPIQALLADTPYDNDVLTDAIRVVAPDLLGMSTPATVYRARRAGQPVAAVIRTVAPDGYRGPIELLVAVDAQGVLIGVQIIRHNETPGLGDQFETRERDWLAAFAGLSLANPPQRRWTVRRDGGDFDAFTGATITPRAIVRSVRRALEYFRANRATIFAESPP